jgi:hypothetical protein
VVSIVNAGSPRFFNPVGRSSRAMAFLVRHLPDAFVASAVRKRFGL